MASRTQKEGLLILANRTALMNTSNIWNNGAKTVPNDGDGQISRPGKRTRWQHVRSSTTTIAMAQPLDDSVRVAGNRALNTAFLDDDKDDLRPNLAATIPEPVFV
jgi:hypothetical protein